MAMSHDMVAHNWANRTRSGAEGFNMWFSGDTIYSYGEHFPIARHCGNAVLFTTDSYSVSTAKHKTITWRACHHLTTFDVADVMANCKTEHKYNYRKMLEAAWEYVGKASRARVNGPWLLDSAKRALADANAYTKHFKLGFSQIADLEALAPIMEKAERNAAARARKAARLAEQQRAEAYRLHLEEQRRRALAGREALKQWCRGENVHPPHTRRPYVRIKNDEVQTSWGARVPLKDALRVFSAARRCRELGKTWTPKRRVTVGHFNVDRIDNVGTIRAGCHVIPFRAAALAYATL